MHGSYRYPSIKCNDFSMTFPQKILTFSGLVQIYKTPILLFWSFTPEAILCRCRHEAANRKSEGFTGIFFFWNIAYLVAFWCNKKINKIINFCFNDSLIFNDFSLTFVHFPDQYEFNDLLSQYLDWMTFKSIVKSNDFQVNSKI